MRERGTQARRAREARDGGESGRSPPSPGAVRFWQVVSIIAIVVATAGWTTVAVIALRPAATVPPVAVASPSAEEPVPSDDASLPPTEESHDLPAMEALLPGELNGTTLTRESWTGNAILSDDDWSTSLLSFLTTSGKTAGDLQVSQAYDAAGAVDINAGAFRVAGIKGAALRDAIVVAWQKEFPDLKTSSTTIGGHQVTTGDFGDGGTGSYWYVRDDVVYDIESGDPSIAEEALAALPVAGASAPGAPPGAASPAASPSASPASS